MKQLFKYLFIGTFLISCSPKYTELNDQGFGGGSQSFKKTDSYSKSKLEKLTNQVVENENQISEKINIELENLQTANPKISRYTSLKIQKANHKSQSLFQFKKRSQQNPKVGNIIEKLTFKSKTLKKNEIDSDLVNVWLKIFLISLLVAVCLLGFGIWALEKMGFYSDFATLLFLFGLLALAVSLVAGFITLILSLMTV
jgi:hypothetical protein